jgi:hypothetical protein
MHRKRPQVLGIDLNRSESGLALAGHPKDSTPRYGRRLLPFGISAQLVCHAYQTRPGQPRPRVQLSPVRPFKADVNSHNMARTAEENAHP